MRHSSTILSRVRVIVLFIFVIGLVIYMPMYAADSGPTPDAMVEEAIAFDDALVTINGVFIERKAFDRAFARVYAHSTAADGSALAI